MAATRLIAMHINKGKSLAQCLEARTDYAQNPEKTEKGELVTSYECDPMTCDEEFLLSKRQYWQYTGREQKGDVIAYQIRQSFKPGEITAEEANRIGYELALAFTKGKHAFIVATHTDRAHVHNHVVFNSTSLDCRRKFRDFKRSGIALQHISDRICLEHGLSVIEPKPYAERVKRTEYPKRPKLRDGICGVINEILDRKPKDFDQFLSMLEAVGYEIKHGKHISVRGKGQKRFIRLRSLGEGYTEEDIRSIIAGKALIRDKKKGGQVHEKPRFNLLIDMQEDKVGLAMLITFVRHMIFKKETVNGYGEKSGYFNIHSPKTEAGIRTVPMLGFVKEAFLMEKQYQEEAEIHCTAKVDGYTDFIFVNRFGMVQHQSTLNKAIRRITRDCNDAVLLDNPDAEVLLPHFSCHSLRHTFTTRMCEAGVNVKVIQDTLGHADISTTLNIYADVTKDLKKTEFEGLDQWFEKKETADKPEEEQED